MDVHEQTERFPDGTQLPPSSGGSVMHLREFAKDTADSAGGFGKPTSAGVSGVSMKSNASIRSRLDFKAGDAQSLANFGKRTSAGVSSVSLSSDASMRSRQDLRSDCYDHSESNDVDGDALFKLVECHGVNILRRELNRYKEILSPHLGANHAAGSDVQEAEHLTTEDERDTAASEGVLKITLHVLKELGHKGLANMLEKHIYGELDVCQRKLRQRLKRFEYIYEGAAHHGNQTLLNKVYTELYITEGSSGTVNSEHEVRQIEAATRRQVTEDEPVKCEDIFKPLLGQDRFIRTVLTKGIAGVGKTISVQKFNLEWAEGRANQDFQLLINLPFRELNLMRRRYTLAQLLHHFLDETRESGISSFGKYRIVLIFDGLDEYRLPLDFVNNEPCCSASKPTSVDVLLTNLIKGNLLPSAHIWITSRPAAADRIPAALVDRVTEIRGFNDPQKEEYFRKKISDQTVASRVISHVKSTRSLYIMCHIPVFSWISATVLQKLLEDTERKEMPKTLTEMYTHFLVYNTQIKNQKYSGTKAGTEAPALVDMDEGMMTKLGKLAFKHLIKGNMIFYKSELNKYSINIDAAAIYSGIFTQVSEKDYEFNVEKVYCFVHLSIQEYFAALYVLHTYISCNKNLLEPQEPNTVQRVPGDVTGLLKSAVDKALQSNNGQLDLFLRFLLGLSQTSNQTLLKSVFTTMGRVSPRNEDAAEYIKEKIKQSLSTERCINLFHCLSELNDQSLLQEVQSCLSSGRLSETKLSPSQWSALVFVLLTSTEDWEEFDLRKYSRSEEALVKLLPVIKESRVAVLKECSLTAKCCEALVPLISSSCLKELDLSDNDLQDSGVKLLSAGLSSPTCQLEKLRLRFCGVTEIGCSCLAEALRSSHTHLRELDLSYNHPGKHGVELLSAVQNDVQLLNISFDANAECYLKSALKKYACKLTLDPDTAHSHLSISEDGRTMARMETAQPYPDRPERFQDWGQVLCKEGLSDRCYWEAEWTGEWTGIGVAYKGLMKANGNFRPVFGYNDKSWGLRYHQGKYTAWYNNNATTISPYFNSKRVGVFLNRSAGTLSFYAVSSDTMTHLHTFHTEFSEPLYAGFRLGLANTSLFL